MAATPARSFSFRANQPAYPHETTMPKAESIR
jgi:hypothetical protein